MSATRCLFIGDDRQAIYGFTGAENDSMNIIKETFNAQELSLPVCYRCDKSIIEKAQEIVSDIQYREDASEGIIRTETYDKFLENATDYSLTKNDGIICRNNAPLVALAFGLIRKGIGCRIEGKDIGRNLITLCNKWKVKDLNTFTNRLIDFTNKEMSKPMNRAKLQLLEDKLDTMIILIERCQSLGKHDMDSLKNLIMSMFSDSDDPKVPNVVVLSSIHKAKGLEWKRCFVLGNSQFIPSRFATQAWQQVQEENLKYIAITRAMEELVNILEVPTRRNNPEE